MKLRGAIIASGAASALFLSGCRSSEAPGPISTHTSVSAPPIHHANPANYSFSDLSKAIKYPGFAGTEVTETIKLGSTPGSKITIFNLGSTALSKKRGRLNEST